MGGRSVRLAAAALLCAAGTAAACGYCVEDKIAAVYDHAVVNAAIGQRHQVAFFAVEGAMPANEPRRLALRRALMESWGIDPGSARLSFDAAAVSVAFDPRRIRFAFVQRELERRLAPHRLSLLPLRVMDRPAELKMP